MLLLLLLLVVPISWTLADRDILSAPGPLLLDDNDDGIVEEGHFSLCRLDDNDDGIVEEDHFSLCRLDDNADGGLPCLSPSELRLRSTPRRRANPDP